VKLKAITYNNEKRRRKMKYLAIAKAKDILYSLPPGVIRQLVEQTMAAMEQQKKEGKILEYYYSPAGCSVVIVDYVNAEQWVQDQAAIPILSYYDQEIYPLSDANQAMKTMVQSLKAAENMMAGASK
jgi:hypothetical protein